MSWQVIEGDARSQLAELEAESVQTCVTSPPYWGLRDYGTATWDGGDPDCDHKSGRFERSGLSEKQASSRGSSGDEASRECPKCGAKRIDSQLGLEPTPEQYAENLVAVFREVRRVLRDDGTVWLNLGDSYAGSWGNQGRKPERGSQRPINGPMLTPVSDGRHGDPSASNTGAVPAGLKPKDLVGIPWRVAFALQADGWYLRSDIIWSKPNPMPESVTDRPTRSHEHVFLLAKSARYFYDAEAIRETFDAPEGPSGSRTIRPGIDTNGGGQASGEQFRGYLANSGRNRRSVWTVTTQPYPEAHFATFPPKLIEPCILAGSPPKACGECGAPWKRVTRVERVEGRKSGPGNRAALGDVSESSVFRTGLEPRTETLGWKPTCDHYLDWCDCKPKCQWPYVLHADAEDVGSSVVLDPFAGAGTTGLVALRHNRSFIGIELNPAYCEMARERIRNDAPLFNVEAEAA